MPEFEPGVAKTAVVQMHNPTAAVFNYLATLYMGVGMTAMCSKEFTLNPDETDNIRFPVAMPFSPGIYPVFFDVWSGATLLGHYQATEDVVIVGPSVPALQSIDYPVYPCFQGRPTSQALVYIPASACPVGSVLTVQFIIPKDSPALPLYNPSNPSQMYSGDWVLLSAELTNADLNSPNSLYWISESRELTIGRYSASYGTTYYDFLPAGTYPIYMRTKLNGVESSYEFVGSMIITANVMSHFTYSSVQTTKEAVGDKYTIHFSAVVTNSGSVAETHRVRVFSRRTDKIWSYLVRAYYDLTLAPGQSATVTEDQTAFSGTSYQFKCIDDQGSMSTTVTRSV